MRQVALGAGNPETVEKTDIDRRRHGCNPAQSRQTMSSTLGNMPSVAVVLANHVRRVLGATTGARLGELLALRWEDIDVEKRQLTIRHALRWEGSTWVLDVPKSQRSRRWWPLAQGR